MDAVEEGLAWDWMGSRQQGHCVRPRLRWCVVRQARQKVWPACMRAASSPKPSLNPQMGRDAPQHCQCWAAPSCTTAKPYAGLWRHAELPGFAPDTVFQPDPMQR